MSAENRQPAFWLWDFVVGKMPDGSFVHRVTKMSRRRPVAPPEMLDEVTALYPDREMRPGLLDDVVDAITNHSASVERERERCAQIAESYFFGRRIAAAIRRARR